MNGSEAPGKFVRFFECQLNARLNFNWVQVTSSQTWQWAGLPGGWTSPVVGAVDQKAFLQMFPLAREKESEFCHLNVSNVTITKVPSP